MSFLQPSVLFLGAKMGHHIERSLDGYVYYPFRPRPSLYLSIFLSLPSRLLVYTMAKLSLTFPPPADTKSVPGEQTQARVEEFRQIPWLEPDWENATRTALQVVERY